ncbi:carbohydrate-binding protein [Dysosmobacter welbionis]|uniref:carbohydrate-binding protein n=1 Tax=Dysosmobacter welbionis TaxID=2093857 RepID=UPI003A8E506A
MYRITKDGNLFAMVGTPVWVLKQANGSFCLCDEGKAEGLVINGKVYHAEGLPEIEGAETVSIVREDDGIYAANLIALLKDLSDLKNAEQFRKALQIFAGSLDEETAMAVSTIYDPYEVGKAYAVDEYFTYGTNEVGDPQLYRVVQAHTSQADWKPDATPALYTPIGLNDKGYPVWSQPTGAHDAYNTGDIVDYNGTLYQSTIDGNVWSPDAYPAGWTIYMEE